MKRDSLWGECPFCWRPVSHPACHGALQQLYEKVSEKLTDELAGAILVGLDEYRRQNQKKPAGQGLPADVPRSGT